MIRTSWVWILLGILLLHTELNYYIFMVLYYPKLLDLCFLTYVQFIFHDISIFNYFTAILSDFFQMCYSTNKTLYFSWYMYSVCLKFGWIGWVLIFITSFKKVLIRNVWLGDSLINVCNWEYWTENKTYFSFTSVPIW